MNGRLEVAVGFEFFGETDDKIMTTSALDDLLLDEPDFLWKTKRGFIVVLDQVIIVFFDMEIAYFRKCTFKIRWAFGWVLKRPDANYNFKRILMFNECI
jgi:hypothetical protein